MHISKLLFKGRRSTQPWPILILLSILLGAIGVLPAQASDPVEVGYRDFAFPSGTGGNSQPTGEKPESKLWWNDGAWWGILWSSAGNAYHIHRLNLVSQDWVDTGTAIDDRRTSRADALWDGQRLYVVSHILAVDSGQPAPAGQRGELYRYRYDSTAKTYALDAGFPLEVTGGKSETLVVSKDGQGQLWVTYVESQKVMVNHSLNGNDLAWNTPFALPFAEAAGLAKDDISAIVAYDNSNLVGVMWSNQSTKKIYFATHPAGSADDVWTRVVAYSISADDHINLKSLEIDNAGSVYSIVKTSRSAALIVLLVCQRNVNGCRTASDWAAYPVYTSKAGSPTRPILLIDTDNRDLYVFTRNKDASGRSGIYYKHSDLDDIQFANGLGVPFIKSATDAAINDPTSTKQNLNASTGLVVLASDKGTKRYFHNHMSLGAPGPPVADFAGAPTSGSAPLTVNFSDLSAGNPTSWDWNFGDGGTSTERDPSHTYNAAGSYTVTLTVGNLSGTDDETKLNYIVADEPPPQFTLTVDITGSGSVVLDPPGGLYDPGTEVTLTASPEPGFVFVGWSGDVSGSDNPETLLMDAGKSVTATFESQPIAGPVTHEETRSGGSSSSNSVTTAGSLSGFNGHLYLAAISTKPRVGVSSVSGLGLTWTRVDAQCAGRNQTGLEVWMAQGTPGGSGTVTAVLAGAPNNAVIAVSRYSGVAGVGPIGNIASANTNGVEAACSGGADSAAYSLNLATAVQGTVVYSAAAMRGASHTPGVGYTERDEFRQGTGGSVASVAAQDKAVASASTVAVDGAFSTIVDWAVVAVEIRPAGALSFSPIYGGEFTRLAHN